METPKLDAEKLPDMDAVIAAYTSVINQAVNVSQQAPADLRDLTYSAVLKHMLENERMMFMMQAQQQQQNKSVLAAMPPSLSRRFN